ncbi:hypothetical protein [Hymenobacter glacieicola]|uniref:Major capsid protein n=1 Tax=Hymenobacter glacieicola TaxID=1562124 RepID=A0ABQ1WMH6_9BACT|nr:hypothetical protein [Hymenobacter glacieicola]GGG34252.1 hypothetical protein GCM10011378_08330 [Hymenobacter glacieicola]
MAKKTRTALKQDNQQRIKRVPGGPVDVTRGRDLLAGLQDLADSAVFPEDLEDLQSEVYPDGEVAGSQVGNIAPGTPVGGLGSIALWELALEAPTVFPTYQPATVLLTQSAPERGEVGELVDNTLSAQYSANDAGAISSLEIRKGTAVALGPASTTSFATVTTSVRRSLADITFQAHASHAAGARKLVQPAGTEDDRPAQLGQPDAPQAANPDLLSNELHFYGLYAILFGPAAAAPTTTTQARALPGYRLTDEGPQFTLETGTQHRFFALLLPPGKSLLAVKDQETNADLRSQYMAQPFAFRDAGGTEQAYTLYLMEQAVAYTSNHHHLITISA